MPKINPVILGFHAHVYFNRDTLEDARRLCSDAAQAFPLTMGRMHTQNVGPHPAWSCQLAFAPEVLGELIPWLAMRRGELVIFVHPISDNELLDHRDRSLWMGAVLPLTLSVLQNGPV